MSVRDGGRTIDFEVAEAVANIGPRGRSRRARIGFVGLAIGCCLVAALVGAELPRAWRLLALAPFWVGALGVLQARAKT